MKRARGLPANLAAFPFGFELPLHDRRPVADLGVTVVRGTRAAAFYEDRGRGVDADPSARGAARVLGAIGAEESPLRDIVGGNMMLEYDIGSAASGTHPEPGIFLRPAERPIVGDGTGERYRDMEVVLRAMVSAIGRDFRAAEQREVERIYGALEPDTRVESFGVFPSRERAIRLAVTGFRGAHELMAFLERAGWRGRLPVVDSTVSRFEERGAFVNLAVHFDLRAGGPGPALGLSFLAKARRPKDPRYWVDSAAPVGRLHRRASGGSAGRAGEAVRAGRVVNGSGGPVLGFGDVRAPAGHSPFQARACRRPGRAGQGLCLPADVPSSRGRESPASSLTGAGRAPSGEAAGARSRRRARTRR